TRPFSGFVVSQNQRKVRSWTSSRKASSLSSSAGLPSSPSVTVGAQPPDANKPAQTNSRHAIGFITLPPYWFFWRRSVLKPLVRLEVWGHLERVLHAASRLQQLPQPVAPRANLLLTRRDVDQVDAFPGVSLEVVELHSVPDAV